MKPVDAGSWGISNCESVLETNRTDYDGKLLWPFTALAQAHTTSSPPLFPNRVCSFELAGSYDPFFGEFGGDSGFITDPPRIAHSVLSFGTSWDEDEPCG